MDIADIKPGMRLTWMHTQRGGYRFVQPVPVVVQWIGGKKVRVEAALRYGGSKSVSVTPDKLRLPQSS